MKISPEEVDDTLTSVCTLKISELKDLCRTMGLKLSGVKKDLVDRVHKQIEHGRTTNNVVKLLTIRTLVLTRMKSSLPLPIYADLYNAIRLGEYSPIREHMTTRPVKKGQEPYRGHALYFRKSPFYKLTRMIYGLPQYCPPVQKERGQVLLLFTLLTDEKQLLASNPNMKLVILCGEQQNLSPSSTDVPLTFPIPVEIHVNDKQVTKNFRGIKNKPGTAKPADITNMIKKDGLNKVQLVYTKTSVAHLIYAYIVEFVTTEELLEKVTQRIIPSFLTVTLINSLLSGQEDDDVIVESDSINVLLKDPLAYIRIRVPIQLIHCKHVQCFDGEVFLELQLQVPTWRCPLCSQSIKLEDLLVCQWMQEVLQNVGDDDIESIEVERDGVWHKKIEKEDDKMGHNLPVLDQLSPDMSFRQNPPAVEIVLLSDEEDEDPAVNERQEPNGISNNSGRNESGGPQSQSPIVGTTSNNEHNYYDDNWMEEVARAIETGSTESENAQQNGTEDQSTRTDSRGDLNEILLEYPQNVPVQESSQNHQSSHTSQSPQSNQTQSNQTQSQATQTRENSLTNATYNHSQDTPNLVPNSNTHLPNEVHHQGGSRDPDAMQTDGDDVPLAQVHRNSKDLLGAQASIDEDAEMTDDEVLQLKRPTGQNESGQSRVDVSQRFANVTTPNEPSTIPLSGNSFVPSVDRNQLLYTTNISNERDPPTDTSKKAQPIRPTNSGEVSAQGRSNDTTARNQTRGLLPRIDDTEVSRANYGTDLEVQTGPIAAGYRNLSTEKLLLQQRILQHRGASLDSTLKLYRLCHEEDRQKIEERHKLERSQIRNQFSGSRNEYDWIIAKQTEEMRSLIKHQSLEHGRCRYEIQKCYQEIMIIGKILRERGIGGKPEQRSSHHRLSDTAVPYSTNNHLARLIRERQLSRGEQSRNVSEPQRGTSFPPEQSSNVSDPQRSANVLPEPQKGTNVPEPQSDASSRIEAANSLTSIFNQPSGVNWFPSPLTDTSAGQAVTSAGPLIPESRQPTDVHGGHIEASNTESSSASKTSSAVNTTSTSQPLDSLRNSSTMVGNGDIPGRVNSDSAFPEFANRGISSVLIPNSVARTVHESEEEPSRRKDSHWNILNEDGTNGARSKDNNSSPVANTETSNGQTTGATSNTPGIDQSRIHSTSPAEQQNNREANSIEPFDQMIEHFSPLHDESANQSAHLRRPLSEEEDSPAKKQRKVTGLLGIELDESLLDRQLTSESDGRRDSEPIIDLTEDH